MVAGGDGLVYRASVWCMLLCAVHVFACGAVFVCALFTHCWIDLFVFQDILFMDFVINILFLDFVRGTNIAGWRRRTGFLIFGGVFFGTSFCVKMRRV